MAPWWCSIRPGQAPAVGLEVEVPVVGLGDREVEHVISARRQATDVAGYEVDGHASTPAASSRLGPPCQRSGPRPSPGCRRARARRGVGHLTGDSGDDDGLALERFCAHGSLSYSLRCPACTSTPHSWEASSRTAGWERTTRWCSSSPKTLSRPAAPPRRNGVATADAHVDALTRLDMIDGFTIGLEKGGSGDRTETEGYNA